MAHIEEDKLEPYELPEHLTEVAPLAEAVLALSERLDELYDEEEEKAEDEADDEAESEKAALPPEAIVALFRELSKAALELAAKLEEDDEALHELGAWSQERELLPRLVELPLGLVNAGQLESALAVARAFCFFDAESFNGDIAVILAESDERDEAVAQLEANLKQFPESGLTAIKAGATHEALGDTAAAEAAYRRAIELAEDEVEEEEAFSQLIGLLEDLGRFDEIDALLAPKPEGSAR